MNINFKLFAIAVAAGLLAAGTGCQHMLDLEPHSAVSPGSVNSKDIEALRKQGVRRIIFATKRATSTFLLSELLEKRAYGEIWSLIHDGENVAFTAVEKKMDISSILTRLQTK